MINNASQNNKIKEYISIVEKVAKVEHRRIPSHMVDYEELVSIGIIAVQAMIKNKTEEQLANAPTPISGSRELRLGDILYRAAT